MTSKRTKDVITPSLLKAVSDFYYTNTNRMAEYTSEAAARLLKTEGILPFKPSAAQMSRIRRDHGMIKLYSIEATRKAARMSLAKQRKAKKDFSEKFREAEKPSEDIGPSFDDAEPRRLQETPEQTFQREQRESPSRDVQYIADIRKFAADVVDLRVAFRYIEMSELRGYLDPYTVESLAVAAEGIDNLVVSIHRFVSERHQYLELSKGKPS